MFWIDVDETSRLIKKSRVKVYYSYAIVVFALLIMYNMFLIIGIATTNNKICLADIISADQFIKEHDPRLGPRP